MIEMMNKNLKGSTCMFMKFSRNRSDHLDMINKSEAQDNLYNDQSNLVQSYLHSHLAVIVEG